MSRTLGVYDLVHGPRGRVLVEYVEENIPLLWDTLPIESVIAVSGSGTQYTGQVPGLFPIGDELTFIIATNKAFWFSPHMDCGDAPELALNGMPDFFPILLAGGDVPSAGDLKEDLVYLLRFTSIAFEIAGGAVPSIAQEAEFTADITSAIAVSNVAQVVSAAAPRLIRLIASAPFTNVEPLTLHRGGGNNITIYPGMSYDSGYPPEGYDKLALTIESLQAGAGYTVRRKLLP